MADKWAEYFPRLFSFWTEWVSLCFSLVKQPKILFHVAQLLFLLYYFNHLATAVDKRSNVAWKIESKESSLLIEGFRP